MVLKLKYDIYMDEETVHIKLRKIINQIYKLLPSREQNKDWEKPLETIMEELAGMQSLINNDSETFFSLLNKLEGLYSLKKDEDFFLFRRVIFECLNLMSILDKQICHQNY